MLNAPGRASPAAENYAGLLSLSGYPKGSVTPFDQFATDLHQFEIPMVW